MSPFISNSRKVNASLASCFMAEILLLTATMLVVRPHPSFFIIRIISNQVSHFENLTKAGGVRVQGRGGGKRGSCPARRAKGRFPWVLGTAFSPTCALVCPSPPPLNTRRARGPVPSLLIVIPRTHPAWFLWKWFSCHSTPAARASHRRGRGAAAKEIRPRSTQPGSRGSPQGRRGAPAARWGPKIRGDCTPPGGTNQPFCADELHKLGNPTDLRPRRPKKRGAGRRHPAPVPAGCCTSPQDCAASEDPRGKGTDPALSHLPQRRRQQSWELKRAGSLLRHPPACISSPALPSAPKGAPPRPGHASHPASSCVRGG